MQGMSTSPLNHFPVVPLLPLYFLTLNLFGLGATASDAPGLLLVLDSGSLLVVLTVLELKRGLAVQDRHATHCTISLAPCLFCFDFFFSPSVGVISIAFLVQHLYSAHNEATNNTFYF